MQKTVLFEVFELLKNLEIVTSESQFSVEWLGRSDCYLRTCRFKRTEPSISSIAVCASKLQHYGNLLSERPQHKRLAETLLLWSERCHKQINQQAEASWVGV